MQPFPHRYRVNAESRAGDDETTVVGVGLDPIPTAPPVEFGGPGDRWSPETLLVAAAVDCFVLTFKAVARASSLSWSELSCAGEGVLDRVDNTPRFTELALVARLTVPEGTDQEKARRLLIKSERSCLVTNSLKLEPTLRCEIAVG